ILALAPRCSMFTPPSADVTPCVRRARSDHSRRLAAQVVEPLLDGDPLESARSEHEFLEHCVSCQDKYAFMLASRDLRRHEIAVGDRWERVADWLEQYAAIGDRAEAPSPRNGCP